MVGERIRERRLAQARSLADVARKARISVATLSRIETEKQTLDLPTFLTIARVLKVDPSEMLDSRNESATGDGLDPLVRSIVGIEPKKRAELWRELAARRKSERGGSARVSTRDLAHELDELLAQISFLHDELASVQKRLKNRR